MIASIKQYTDWLHGQWPTPHVEKLPKVDANGHSSMPGVYIVGDLSGVPLLKFSADTGAKAIQDILADDSFAKSVLPAR